LVAATGQRRELVHAGIRQSLDVVEEIRALAGRGLHVGILVLHRAGQERQVHVPDRRHAAPFRPVQHLLCRRRRIDQVVGTTQVFGHQFALGQHAGFDQVGGEEAVLADDGRRQRKLGGLARDQVQVGRRIERLVHEGHALRRGEIGRTQTGHRHAGGDAGCGVLGLGLDEDQRLVGDVEVALGDFLRPVFAHLRRGRDRVGAGGIRRLALDVDHGRVAVDRIAHPGVLELASFHAGAGLRQQAVGEHLFDHRECHGSFLKYKFIRATAAARCAGSSSRRRPSRRGRGCRTRRWRRWDSARWVRAWPGRSSRN